MSLPRPRACRPSAPTPPWAAGLLLLLAAVLARGAEDPYQLWSHGRPAEAIPALLLQAQASERWDAWLDLGLAAAAAGDRGRAAVWLVAARARAPERDEPRAALRALGAELPPSWPSRCGPLAWAGSGWPGVVGLGLVGSALGYALAARRGRAAGLLVALLGALAVAPGLCARILEGRLALVAAVRDTQLLDSTGSPIGAVAGGTVAVQESPTPWSGRLRVALADGRRGYLAQADTRAEAGVEP
jgi:hypothetical protein